MKEYTKTIYFEYKGQMINYYNKIKVNDNITSIFFGPDSKGYSLTYSKKF